MAKTAAERKADARDRKRAQRQREREAASIAAVSGRRRITFEVSDHLRADQKPTVVRGARERTL